VLHHRQHEEAGGQRNQPARERERAPAEREARDGPVRRHDRRDQAAQGRDVQQVPGAAGPLKERLDELADEAAPQVRPVHDDLGAHLIEREARRGDGLNAVEQELRMDRHACDRHRRDHDERHVGGDEGRDAPPRLRPGDHPQSDQRQNEEEAGVVVHEREHQQAADPRRHPVEAPASEHESQEHDPDRHRRDRIAGQVAEQHGQAIREDARGEHDAYGPRREPRTHHGVDQDGQQERHLEHDPGVDGEGSETIEPDEICRRMREELHRHLRERHRLASERHRLDARHEPAEGHVRVRRVHLDARLQDLRAVVVEVEHGECERGEQ
jgi:hypothetical protein